MKFEENINETEYENFVSSHKKSHFMQSYYWGEVMKKKNFTPHYVGLKKKNKLVATALLLEKKLPKGYCYFYCPRGYIIDFNDFEILKSIFCDTKSWTELYNDLYEIYMED